MSAISLSPLHVYAEGGASGAATTMPVSGSTGGESGNDSAEQKIENDQVVKSAHQSLTQAYATGQGVGLEVPQHALIDKETQNYMSKKGTCVSTHSGAAKACLENLSPHILTGVTTLNTLMNTIGSVAVKDQCSKFSNAMDIAKAAMTAYTAACGAAKAGCGFYCVSARNSVIKLNKISSSGASCAKATPQTMAACTQQLAAYNNSFSTIQSSVKDEGKKEIEKSMAGKAGICTEKYANLLASAVSGIAGLMNAINQGKECEEETKGDPTAPGTDPLKEKCSDPANANLPECICLKNPRTPGCSNSYEKPGELNAGGNIGTGATDRTNVAATGGGPDLGMGGGATPEFPGRNPTSDSGGSSAPAGGGAGGSLGGGSGGGSGGMDGEKSEAAKKGLDTNILGGAGGGGGGGWGAGGGGSSDSKYRSYLPGGKNDPSKGMAGSQAWTKEVTGQGGKSNWDKIKERYRDNKSTLLNN
ncbi:hypothetical protein ACES2L_15530 [Bdellovibrio bacteriovorus]